jgi:hypothetical protein
VVAILSKSGRQQSILMRLSSRLMKEAVDDVEGVQSRRRYVVIDFVAAVVPDSALAEREALGLQSALLVAKISC